MAYKCKKVSEDGYMEDGCDTCKYDFLYRDGEPCYSCPANPANYKYCYILTVSSDCDKCKWEPKEV